MSLLKRLIAFIDLLAIAVTVLFLFAIALIALGGAARTIWGLMGEMYAARHDWWIVALVVFSLAWSAVRRKAARKALDEIDG